MSSSYTWLGWTQCNHTIGQTATDKLKQSFTCVITSGTLFFYFFLFPLPLDFQQVCWVPVITVTLFRSLPCGHHYCCGSFAHFDAFLCLKCCEDYEEFQLQWGGNNNVALLMTAANNTSKKNPHHHQCQAVFFIDVVATLCGYCQNEHFVIIEITTTRDATAIIPLPQLLTVFKYRFIDCLLGWFEKHNFMTWGYLKATEWKLYKYYTTRSRYDWSSWSKKYWWMFVV